MRAKTALTLMLGITCVATVADARDDHLKFPLADVLSSAEAKKTLDPTVQLYFGKQPYAEPVKRLSTGRRRTRRPTSSTRPIRKGATGCSCRR